MTNEKGDVGSSRKRRKESQKSPRSTHPKDKVAATEPTVNSAEIPAVTAPSETPPNPESRRSAKKAAKQERVKKIVFLKTVAYKCIISISC